jgi:hypothetical protein
MQRLFACSLAAFSMTLTALANAPVVDDAVAWSQTADQFAAGFSGQHPPEFLQDMLDPSASIQAFDRDRVESARVISSRIAARQVVSVRSYIHPSVSAASDLIEDLKKLDNLPPNLAEQLILNDPHALRQADATMARWFSIVLDAEAGEPVALIALLDDGSADIAAGRVARDPRLILMLVKGTLAEGRQPRITRIVYGDTDQATK